jgi:hypothetical protein
MGAVIIIVETDPPSPSPGIPPPIIVGIRIVIERNIFFPEIDLFALNQRISVFHFSNRFESLSLNLSSDGNLSTPSEEIGIEIFLRENHKTAFRGRGKFGFSPSIEWPLKDFKKGGSIFSVHHLDHLPTPDDYLSSVGLGIFGDFSETEGWVCLGS